MKVAVAIVPRFRNLQAEFRIRDEFYALSKEERDAQRLKRLNAQWRKAREHSPYYSALSRAQELPECFSSIEEYKELVPITPKSAVQQNPMAFKLPEYRRGKWMSTGGSTGTPLRVFWSLSGHLESLRDQYWARLWWGIRPFDRQVMLWGHSHSFGRGLTGAYHKAMVPLVDRLRARKRFSAYALDTETLRKYYDAMVRFRPKSIYAYSSAAHLLALANRERPPLPENPKVAFLAAEPVLHAYRESVSEVFDCPCAGEYGSIECGMIAYEHPNGAYQVFERSVIVETVKRESGYLILVTQLRDTGFPLFRYEIGDITSVEMRSNSQGIEQLEQICGRSHDLIRSKSGHVCHGETITHIMEQIPNIVLFTVKQRRDYSLTLLVQTQTAENLSEESRKWITGKLRNILGPQQRIDIECRGQLERTLAGKHRWIVSELDSPDTP